MERRATTKKELAIAFAVFLSLAVTATNLFLMIYFSEMIKFNNRKISSHIEDTNTHYHLLRRIEFLETRDD